MKLPLISSIASVVHPITKEVSQPGAWTDFAEYARVLNPVEKLKFICLCLWDLHTQQRAILKRLEDLNLEKDFSAIGIETRRISALVNIGEEAQKLNLTTYRIVKWLEGHKLKVRKTKDAEGRTAYLTSEKSWEAFIQKDF